MRPFPKVASDKVRPRQIPDSGHHNDEPGSYAERLSERPAHKENVWEARMHATTLFGSRFNCGHAGLP